MSEEVDLEELLAPSATNSERVRGLYALGLPPKLVADATDSTVSTLRNWISGATQPRGHAAIVLDDLRMVAKLLLDHQMEPERAARWMTSRDPARFEGRRPIDAIVDDPMDVMAAAYAEIERRNAAAAPPSLQVVGGGTNR